MPIVTFTSDVGMEDFITAAVKGQLLQANPSFTIIDITHNLSPFNFLRTAYVCKNAIKNFPVGSFHLILVNVFDEKTDHLLIAEHNGHYIGCADNGLLTMVLEELPQKVVALPLQINRQNNMMYYAEVFAKAIHALDNGKKIEELGNVEVSINVKNPLKPTLGPNWIEGQIIFIDNFENVVVNISKEEFEEQRKGRNFKISFRRDDEIDKISETYADVQQGEKLALFNSAGYLEIAINKGNAAGLLGLQGYSEKQQQSLAAQDFNRLFIYQTVKIFFQ